MATNDKVWHAAYQNKRTAARRYDLYQSRHTQGLDLTTGQKPEEILRLAQLQSQLRDLEFEIISPNADPTAIADKAEALINELETERAKEGSTAEYRRAFWKFSATAIETLAAIVKRYQPQTEPI